MLGGQPTSKAKAHAAELLAEAARTDVRRDVKKPRARAWGFRYDRGVRHVALLFALGACGFEHGSLTIDAPSSDGIADADPDGAPDIGAAFCNPADLDLRACFTFDGNTQDGSSYGNHATASTPVFVTGNSGQALLTTSGTITVPATTSFDVGALTIRMWIKPNMIPTGGARMGLIDSASRWRLFLQSDGALRCALSNGVDFTTAVGKVVANQWQRVACAYDGSVMRVYVDGNVVGTSNIASTFQMPGTGMVIGHDNPSGSNFIGAIDELQIWGSIVAP